MSFRKQLLISLAAFKVLSLAVLQYELNSKSLILVYVTTDIGGRKFIKVVNVHIGQYPLPISLNTRTICTFIWKNPLLLDPFSLFLHV